MSAGGHKRPPNRSARKIHFSGNGLDGCSKAVRLRAMRDMTEPGSAGVRQLPPSTVVRRIEQHTGSRKPAVDIEHVARNVGGIGGCEESNCGRDVGRLRVSL